MLSSYVHQDTNARFYDNIFYNSNKIPFFKNIINVFELSCQVVKDESSVILDGLKSFLGW